MLSMLIYEKIILDIVLVKTSSENRRCAHAYIMTYEDFTGAFKKLFGEDSFNASLEEMFEVLQHPKLNKQVS